jgi:hypothetical protein
MHELVETVSVLERPEVKKQIARARAQLDGLDAQLRSLVKERPMVTMGAAVFLGYVLGRLLVRR